MNDFNHIWELVNQYPTCVPFYLFALTAALMILSFMTGLFTDIDAHFDIHLLDDLLVSCGVSKVPLVIGLCLTFLPMTIISLLLQESVFDSLQSLLNDVLFYAIATIYILISFVVCLYIGGFISKPIAKFIKNNTSYVIDYLGQTGKVVTNIDVGGFGYAKCSINYSEHTLKVYSEVPLKSGDQVTILEYKKESDKYLVKKV
jgi:membrane-bound ClpP family serine protease